MYIPRGKPNRRISKFRGSHDDRWARHLAYNNSRGVIVNVDPASNEFLSVNKEFLNEPWEFLSGD